MKNLKFILLALVHLVVLANSAQAHYIRISGGG
jgi:hypothetical protein